MDFIVDNSAAGDVISYGCANDSTRHMHTAMVQHVDTEKILLYHSNYASGNYTLPPAMWTPCTGTAFGQSQHQYQG